MRIILGSDNSKHVAIRIRPLRILLFLLPFLLCVLVFLAILSGNPQMRLFAGSGFFVSFGVLVGVGAIYLYPQVFDIRTIRIPGFFLVSYLLMIILPLPWFRRDFGGD